MKKKWAVCSGNYPDFSLLKNSDVFLDILVKVAQGRVCACVLVLVRARKMIARMLTHERVEAAEALEAGCG